MNEVIDLVDDVSFVGGSSGGSPSRRSPGKHHRRRRHGVGQKTTTATTKSTTDTAIDVEAFSSPSHKSRKRSRHANDEVIEILSPIAPPAASKRKQQQQKQPTPQLYDLSKSNPISRIREVFPLVSRQKVQSFLDRAASYVEEGDDDDTALMSIVMTVLSEYPTGSESIPDEAFAAAAVGGHIEADATTATTTLDDDNVKLPANATTGKRKIAQLECNCCYVEYPYEEMVSCRLQGHLFCKTCLQKHTEQRVFGQGNLGVKTNTSSSSSSAAGGGATPSKALEILCMHSSGCTSGFHEGQLRKALSSKVLKKYDEMRFTANIENFGDISKCPKCNYIAFAEKELRTFHCPQCSFKSCRECGDEAHPGITCDEVETKTETDGRKNVEEAMTQALVRTCPRPFCRKKFMKSDGCNKMTCACGAYVCYVCRKEIPKNVAYAHFCQKPHCNHKSCGKCALYADVEKEDAKRVKEAAKKAAKKQKTSVDVESLLKNPNPPPVAAAAAIAPRHGHVGHNNNMIAIQQQIQQLQQQNQQAQLNLQRAIERLNQRQRQHGGRGGRRRNRNRGGR